MGIRTWPGYELLGDDSGCFPAGLTPKKMYVSVTGVEFCDYIPIAQRTDSPNRTFICEQTGNPNIWVFGDGTFLCVYWANDYPGPPGFSGVHVVTPHHGTPAFTGKGDPCQTAFENLNIEGACHPLVQAAYGGKAQVFWRPADSSPSIRGIMEKINMTPEKQTFCEAWPLDADNFIVRFARQKDGTCIYIKYEHTL